jgi:hypothetical protein
MKRSDRHRSRPRRWTTPVLGVLVTVGPIVGTTTSADHAGAATSANAASSHAGVTVVRQLPGAPAGPSTPLPASIAGSGAPSPGPDFPHRIGGHQPEAKIAAGSAATTNWSGAVATGGTFDGIASHWTVPTVQSSSTAQYSATWIGIDGWENTDLIQVGTAQATATTPHYFAWYEVLPTDPVAIDIPETVSAGDQMAAEIYKETTAATWVVDIKDTTKGWTFGGTTAYTGPTTSAEWIEEAPTVSTSQSTLADFGSVQFTTAFVASSTTDFTLTPIFMVASPQTRIIAYPGTPTTGGFSVFYGTPKPAVTSVSPSQGSTAGGTDVTIGGTYLTSPYPPVTAIDFGTTPATSFSANGQSITATAPAGSAGTVDVRVVTADGSSPTSPADRFTYVTPTPPPAPTPGPPAGPSSGYDMVGSDGGVFVFPVGQSGGYYGSLPGDHVSIADVVGMVPTPSDTGYFLVGADGGVFSFGNAPYLGSLPGDHDAVDDIRGIVPTSDNGGYFLVGADGGVFAFGDAPYLGSLPGDHVTVDDVVGLAATPDDGGYWLVTSTGRVYQFGDATNYGYTTGAPSPVSGIDSTPDGRGYWVVTQNGSVYAYGDASYFGSLPQSGVTPARPVIGLVPTSDDKGYWLIGADGGIFAYGDASFEGSLPQVGADVTDVVGAVPTKA